MQKIKITYGGWYQRTTLHLSEAYDFMAFGRSKLDLDKSKLKKLHKSLELVHVSREASYLEYISAETESGIAIRYYEDGLYILEMETNDIKKAKVLLERYFEQKFGPAIGYIFSLGAPTPKVLANIKTPHATVVSMRGKSKEREAFLKRGGHFYNKMESGETAVYKTHDFIFVAVPENAKAGAGELVENLIFFREFKDQLEKYLQIHRILWEEISRIKEQKEIKGNDVEAVRGKLDSYQVTISLINNRINQMGSYVRTRASISKHTEVEQHLNDLFQYKFETLTDTLEYIKEIWKMTSDYLNSSIQNLVEIKGQSAARGIQSLQLITSVGVISGIVGYLSKNELPRITMLGAAYFFIVIAATWIINSLITKFYRGKKYTLKFSQRKEDI
jgi:hypothetical protein